MHNSFLQGWQTCQYIYYLITVLVQWLQCNSAVEWNAELDGGTMRSQTAANGPVPRDKDAPWRIGEEKVVWVMPPGSSTLAPLGRRPEWEAPLRRRQRKTTRWERFGSGCRSKRKCDVSQEVRSSIRRDILPAAFCRYSFARWMRRARSSEAAGCDRALRLLSETIHCECFGVWRETRYLWLAGWIWLLKEAGRTSETLWWAPVLLIMQITENSKKHRRHVISDG